MKANLESQPIGFLSSESSLSPSLFEAEFYQISPFGHGRGSFMF